MGLRQHLPLIQRVDRHFLVHHALLDVPETEIWITNIYNLMVIINFIVHVSIVIENLEKSTLAHQYRVAPAAVPLRHKNFRARISQRKIQSQMPERKLNSAMVPINDILLRKQCRALEDESRSHVTLVARRR